MLKLLYIFVFLPVFLVAQNGPVNKTKANINSSSSTLGGYSITGHIEGIADNTIIYLINILTGVQEFQTTIKHGKFNFQGKLDNPDYKLLRIDGHAKDIPLFLDKNAITISGNINALNDLTISGSIAQNEMSAFNHQIAPFLELLKTRSYDAAAKTTASKLCEDFAKQHLNSFISIFAIFDYSQLVGTDIKARELFKALDPIVKTTDLSRYLDTQMIKLGRHDIGTILPDFSLADTAGNFISLHAFRGKYVLVDFWASWCAPCRAESPYVSDAFKMFKDKNFTVLGISKDRDKGEWLEAISADDLTWTHLIDFPDPGNSVCSQFGLIGIPGNFLLDPNGKILAKNLRGENLIKKLQELIK